MRVAPGTLLVVIAVLLPFIVQIRTVVHYLGYDMAVTTNAAIGAVIIAAVVVWAVLPAGLFGDETESA